MVILFEALFGCHGVLIRDTSPKKWMQCLHMTISVEWEVKQEINKDPDPVRLLSIYCQMSVNSNVDICF